MPSQYRKETHILETMSSDNMSPEELKHFYDSVKSAAKIANDHPKETLAGGSIFSGIKEFLTKAYDYISDSKLRRMIEKCLKKVVGAGVSETVSNKVKNDIIAKVGKIISAVDRFSGGSVSGGNPLSLVTDTLGPMILSVAKSMGKQLAPYAKEAVMNCMSGVFSAGCVPCLKCSGGKVEKPKKVKRTTTIRAPTEWQLFMKALPKDGTRMVYPGNGNTYCRKNGKMSKC